MQVLIGTVVAALQLVSRSDVTPRPAANAGTIRLAATAVTTRAAAAAKKTIRRKVGRSRAR